jgi:uncharacterized protein (DUF1501 family)
MARSHETGACRGFAPLDALTRRELLRVGSLGALGLSLPALLRAESAAAAADYLGEKPVARAKSCIFLFLAGGPPQHETFDPKPDARADVRSIFPATPTNVPGTHICSLLPNLAKLADKYALLRSAYHKYGGHFGGHRYVLTGHAIPGNADQPARADDKPGIASLVAKHFYNEKGGTLVPAAMAPWVATDQGSTISGGMMAGTLGRQFDPVRVEVNQKAVEPPNLKPGAFPAFSVPAFALQPGVSPDRLDRRRDLLEEIDNQRDSLDKSGEEGRDAFYRRAFEILTSPKVREGFDLSHENEKTRMVYGGDAFGQSCLLSRRLVERGVRFVQVNFARYVTQPGYGWDIHGGGEQTLKNHLLPKLDTGLSALLNDLSARGLLDSTLVVAMGEFGRTPKVKKDGGRDHWPQCYSVLLAGGGIKGGLVYGRSDAAGAYPAESPVEARQLIVTILNLLGIPDFGVDALGRAAPLFDGVEPVRGLYS